MSSLPTKIGIAVGVVAVAVGAIVLLVGSGDEKQTSAPDGTSAPAVAKAPAESCQGSPTPFHNTDPRGCGKDGTVIFSSQCQQCIEKSCKGAETCQGGGLTPEQSALCNEVLDCVDDSGCNDGRFAIFCYCGAVTTEECDAGQGKGACRALIEKGLSSKDPTFVQNNLFDVAQPAGRAMARIDCGNAASCGKLCQ